MIYLINLLIAEVAAYITYSSFVGSPLRYFIPYPAEMLLFAFPLVGLLFKRPFNFYFYSLLIFFNISPIMSDSEFFKGFVNTLGFIDTLYPFGIRDVAESLYAAFSSYSGSIEPLLTVTWLYITAEILHGNWESIRAAKTNGVLCERCNLSYLPAFLFSLIIFLLYPLILNLKVEFEMDRILSAAIGIFAFFAGVYILAKSVEEKDEIISP